MSQPKLPSDKDGIVRIMSLHKSKGLTAKCVIIIGCTAGVLPFVKPKEGMTAAQRLRIIEEQRRLFYVALTRTTKTLVISSAAAMLKADARRTGNTSSAVRAGGAGGTASLNPSPFISELGNHGVTTVSGRRWKASLGF
ncbi:3'-5' exonuclease [Hymenobacter algoricola]|uniref:3'-5' exonuclease n=1 Tax=Hymenobacter algoricola TaxID=486267 RepID=UPI003CD0C01F